MTEFRKEIKIGNSGMYIEVYQYNEPDDYKEKMKEYEDFRKSGKLFGGPNPPIAGGPIIAHFYNELLADEYIKFKTAQLKNR